MSLFFVLFAFVICLESFYFSRWERNMKSSFQKTLIVASAGVAMFAAVSTANANSLLFPYFTTTSGAQSALSIASNTNAVGAPETLHYVYNYGDACTHFDGNGKVTVNDLMQHSIASPSAGGYGKAAGADGSTPFYFPLANSYGFLVVSSKTTAADNVITGDMAIVDPSTGLVVSYPGISNGLDTSVAANEGNFSAITDGNFNLTGYGAGLVDTAWYGVVVGNMSTAIGGNTNWTGSATLNNGGVVYDNDEQGFSGAKSKTLTCAGKFGAADLMTGAQQASVGPNGGLIHATASDLLNGASGLVLNKLQVVKAAAGAPFSGKQFLHREAKAF